MKIPPLKTTRKYAILDKDLKVYEVFVEGYNGQTKWLSHIKQAPVYTTLIIIILIMNDKRENIFEFIINVGMLG